MNKNFQKRVKIPTPERLSNIALHYLSRFAASEQSLRKVLENRIRRASMRDPAFAAEAEKHAQLRLHIETIIEKHRKTGALNDTAYAEMKVRGLRRAGKSKRAIQQVLAAKGIGRDTARDSLAGDEDTDPEEAELKAAQIFAKRKKLGPFRAGGSVDATNDMMRRAVMQKEMSAMARRGFSIDVIRKVLESSAEDMPSSSEF